MRVNRKTLMLWFVIPAVAMGLGCGCPVGPPSPPAAAVLEGDWLTTDEDDDNAVVRFDETGVVIGILSQTEAGNFVLVEVSGATTELTEDGAVTITIPTTLGNAVFTGTLSDDENTMTGQLARTIDIGDAITVIIPEGPLTLQRITEICDLVTCDEDQECVDGECVDVDPCEDVVCIGTEVCVDGECVPIDPCEDVVCVGTEVCVDGECVPIDPCEDVVCVGTEVCVDGECVPEPEIEPEIEPELEI